MKLVVGTRGSQLSLIQTDLVLRQLRKLAPDVHVTKRIIHTLGDRRPATPLYQFQRKGIFEKEIDRAVERGDIDFAVHSLKDLPATEDYPLDIVAIPRRGPPNDVLVSQTGRTLQQLPHGARVGTSSLRRAAQLRYMRPDLQVEPIRGNVETRLAKLGRAGLHAIVLAEAGIRRLGLRARITERLPLRIFTPAAGQGALAVVCNPRRTELSDLLGRLNHSPSRAATLAERTVLSEMQGGCRVPLGVIGTTSHARLRVYASIYGMDGDRRLMGEATASMEDAVELGRRVAQQLLDQGAAKFEAEWRDVYGWQ